ncbi:hypothetical protein ACFWUW_25925 [Streptomyces sp. NPDC058655]|uniref:hypothetical protein n=1 Tax=Streptomyces sp. NPDC058655 TaxID=3346577 RepID=UPI0036596484
MPLFGQGTVFLGGCLGDHVRGGAGRQGAQFADDECEALGEAVEGGRIGVAAAVQRVVHVPAHVIADALGRDLLDGPLLDLGRAAQAHGALAGQTDGHGQLACSPTASSAGRGAGVSMGADRSTRPRASAARSSGAEGSTCSAVTVLPPKSGPPGGAVVSGWGLGRSWSSQSQAARAARRMTCSSARRGCVLQGPVDAGVDVAVWGAGGRDELAHHRGQPRARIRPGVGLVVPDRIRLLVDL